MDTFLLKYCPPSDCKLVIFDWDDTLCPVGYKKDKLEQHIIDILLYFRMHRVKMAIASLNTMAKYFAKIYNVKHFFEMVEERESIFLFHKRHMLRRIISELNIKPENIILFDDNIRNCIDANRMNIKQVHINPNYRLLWNDIHKGMKKFHKRRHST